MTTLARVQCLLDAYNAGRAYADSLNVGDSFMGVMAPARVAFPDDKAAATLFMDGALDALPCIIRVDDDGRLTFVGRRA